MDGERGGRRADAREEERAELAVDGMPNTLGVGGVHVHRELRLRDPEHLHCSAAAAVELDSKAKADTTGHAEPTGRAARCWGNGVSGKHDSVPLARRLGAAARERRLGPRKARKAKGGHQGFQTPTASCLDQYSPHNRSKWTLLRPIKFIIWMCIKMDTKRTINYLISVSDMNISII